MKIIYLLFFLPVPLDDPQEVSVEEGKKVTGVGVIPLPPV